MKTINLPVAGIAAYVLILFVCVVGAVWSDRLSVQEARVERVLASSRPNLRAYEEIPSEKLRGIVLELMTLKAKSMVSPERLIYRRVREGEVLDLADACGNMLVLDSSGPITLSRHEFAKDLKTPDGCSVWMTNGNLVGGRTITIPYSVGLLTRGEYGKPLVLAPIMRRRVLFWKHNVANVWIEAYNEEMGS